jgi:hypothetical protein
MGTTLVNPSFHYSRGYSGVLLLLGAFFNNYYGRPLCTEQKYNPALHAHKQEPLPQLVHAGVVKAIKPPDSVLVSTWDSEALEMLTLSLKAVKAFFRRSISH